MIIQCPHCLARIRVQSVDMGCQRTCAQCHGLFQIPEDSSDAAYDETYCTEQPPTQTVLPSDSGTTADAAESMVADSRLTWWYSLAGLGTLTAVILLLVMWTRFSREERHEPPLDDRPPVTSGPEGAVAELEASISRGDVLPRTDQAAARTTPGEFVATLTESPGDTPEKTGINQRETMSEIPSSEVADTAEMKDLTDDHNNVVSPEPARGDPTRGYLSDQELPSPVKFAIENVFGRGWVLLLNDGTAIVYRVHYDVINEVIEKYVEVGYYESSNDERISVVTKYWTTLIVDNFRRAQDGMSVSADREGWSEAAQNDGAAQFSLRPSKLPAASSEYWEYRSASGLGGVTWRKATRDPEFGVRMAESQQRDLLDGLKVLPSTANPYERNVTNVHVSEIEKDSVDSPLVKLLLSHPWRIQWKDDTEYTEMTFGPDGSWSATENTGMRLVQNSGVWSADGDTVTVEFVKGDPEGDRLKRYVRFHVEKGIVRCEQGMLTRGVRSAWNTISGRLIQKRQ